MVSVLVLVLIDDDLGVMVTGTAAEVLASKSASPE